MQKHLSLSLAVAVTLSGCSAFQTSQTWKAVVENRAGSGADTAAKDEYADRLHAVLAAEHVEHKVVTYQYRYRTRLREEAVNAASAVIYRDAVTPNNPWWLMDDRLRFPVWLPNGDTARQLTFYLRREAEVLEEKDYAGDDAHKSIARLSPRSPRLQVAQIAKRPKTRQPFATAQPVVVQVQPKGTPAPKASFAARRVGTPAAPLSHRIQPALKRTVWATRAPRVNASPGLYEPRYAALFRVQNGTRYNPASPMDREKMEVLRQRFFQRHATVQLR